MAIKNLIAVGAAELAMSTKYGVQRINGAGKPIAEYAVTFPDGSKEFRTRYLPMPDAAPVAAVAAVAPVKRAAVAPVAGKVFKTAAKVVAPVVSDVETRMNKLEDGLASILQLLTASAQ